MTGQGAYPTIAHALSERAQSMPGADSVEFLGEPAEQGTFGSLHEQVSALAGWLADLADPGDRALLLFPPGMDYVRAFLACLHAGILAVPAYPPTSERQRERLLGIIEDSAPAVALTQSGLLEIARQQLGGQGAAGQLRWQATDGPLSAEPLPAPRPHDSGVAFLQYTSGSTRAPKGVAVTHRGLIDNSEAIRRAFGHGPGSVGVIWLPPYHDMGLIGGILQPIYAGFRVKLMSPLDFLADPRSWLEALTEHGGTTSGGPNFAFELCVRKVPAEQREGLDLRSWDVAFTGAEKVRPETLERFADAFGEVGFKREAFLPCYGLAEATLMVSSADRGAGARVAGSAEQGAAPVVSCGRPIPGHRVAIVRPGADAPLPDGQVGEIRVAGPSVADGYWNAPQETAEAFGVDETGQPAVRTGDLGFVRDGELFVTGREKAQLVVRGRNLAAEDVEHLVGSSHPKVRPGCVAAFGIDTDEGEGLAVVAEVRSGSAEHTGEIVRAVQEAVVAEFGIRAERVLLVAAGAVPKTPNGKVQRIDARQRLVDGSLPLVADHGAALGPGASDNREGHLAEEIASTAAEVLDLPEAEVAPGMALSGLGLDSLRAVQLRARVKERLSRELPLEAILTGASPEELALHAREWREQPTRAPSDAVTDGELALLMATAEAERGDHYVLSVGLELDGPVDPGVLDRARALLADRHPALRTRFPAADAGERRRVLAEPPELHVIDAASHEVFERVTEQCAEAPVDPASAPAWRVALARPPRGKAVLVLVIHHVLCDLWSLDLLARELVEIVDAAATGARPSLPSAGDPGRLAGNRAAALAGAHGERLESFWTDQLRSLPSAGGLPQARPHTLSAPPARRDVVRIDRERAAQLRALARRHDTTTYGLLVTSVAWLLHAHDGQRRFVLGVPASGRLEPDAMAAVGYFVNALPLECEVDPDETLGEHLRRLQDRLAGLLAHQEYPYQRICEATGAASSELIRVVIAEQQAPVGGALTLLAGGELQAPRSGLSAKARWVEQRTAPFQLTIEVVDTGDEVVVSFIYDAEALTPGEVEAVADRWQRLLGSLASGTVRPRDIDLLSADERKQLKQHPNAPVVAAAGPATLDEAVVESAADDAEVAARDDALAVTYGQLRRRSAHLAHALRGHARGCADPVAILMGRSTDTVVAMLAALRAGMPYVPLDPEQPRHRLTRILDDARPAAVVTTTELAAGADLPPGLPVVVEADPNGAPTHPLATATEPDALASVMYTSGSTGAPKGVAVGHRGVLNLLDDFRRRVPIGPGDRCGWWTSPGFDVSVFEVFAALTSGAAVEACPPSARHDADALMRWIARRGITVAYLPPHLLADVRDWLRANPGEISLRGLLVGVEPIPAGLLADIARAVPGLRIVNGYGPTEATVCCTLHDVDPDATAAGATPLGRPVQNTPVHLLDDCLRPVPPGGIGEVYVGGAGLARGYHRRPDLTAERFVPSPFGRGERLYRTGDLARQGPEGALRFVGRADDQVKVLGVRVEPREVEAVLSEHPAVTQALVVASQRGDGSNLIGYARVGTGASEDEGLESDIISHVRQRLPSAMVPQRLLLVERWPTTLNGKVDRDRLPAHTARPTAYQAPVGPVEERIAQTWADFLERPRVGRDEDFFELGGHSLMAMRIVASLSERLGARVTVTQLTENPTVSGLAAALAASEPTAGGSAPDDGDSDALLRHVAALPTGAWQRVCATDGEGARE